LAELARETGAQVLVVTHLPQVAAAADTQYVVAKVEKGGRAEARVERLDASARVEELSRMLAGMPDSERAQEHARELLQVADRES
jgi:DNA repair protein RecN (Recombination protein N)